MDASKKTPEQAKGGGSSVSPGKSDRQSDHSPDPYLLQALIHADSGETGTAPDSFFQ